MGLSWVNLSKLAEGRDGIVEERDNCGDVFRSLSTSDGCLKFRCGGRRVKQLYVFGSVRGNRRWPSKIKVGAE